MNPQIRASGSTAQQKFLTQAKRKTGSVTPSVASKGGFGSEASA